MAKLSSSSGHSNISVPFADLELSRRLESTEGFACKEFAEARQKLTPESNAEWMEHAGAYVIFDTPDSPVTQTFCLGLFEDLTDQTLKEIEKFFFDRRAPVNHEVSPHVGVAALNLLCDRKYRPMEISSVLYQPITKPRTVKRPNIKVRLISPAETDLWAKINAIGWGNDMPDAIEFIESFGLLAASREHSPCFLAELDGEPAATASLTIHDGVALFAGAATIPKLRGQGLQGALLQARLRYAFEQGCDLAMMVTEAGSTSQHNAERNGFHVAYTRTKWHLPAPRKRR